MSDLINRDELIKELEAHCNNVSGDVDSVIGQTYRMAYQHAIEVVKIYPPAYDFDNIVAELEEEKKKSLKLWQQYKLKDDIGKMFGFKEAIDIVKRGGVK